MQFITDIREKGLARKFYLPVTLENVLEHEALLDTGADITLISAPLFTRLQSIAHSSNLNLKLQKCSLEVLPFAAKTTTLKSMALIHFSLGTMNLVHPVYVSPQDTIPLLIGKDFLNRFEPLVDFQRLKIYAQVRQPLPIASPCDTGTQGYVTEADDADTPILTAPPPPHTGDATSVEKRSLARTNNADLNDQEQMVTRTVDVLSICRSVDAKTDIPGKHQSSFLHDPKTCVLTNANTAPTPTLNPTDRTHSDLLAYVPVAHTTRAHVNNPVPTLVIPRNHRGVQTPTLAHSKPQSGHKRPDSDHQKQTQTHRSQNTPQKQPKPHKWGKTDTHCQPTKPSSLLSPLLGTPKVNLKPVRFCRFARAMWNIIPLILGLTVINAFTDIMEPGPNSGIVLKENPGLLITNCRLHTQKVFVKINPREVCRRNLPLSDNQNEISWAGEKWDRIVVEHAEADVTYLLTQLQKFTVTQAELHGTDPRSRRAIGGLFTAASFVGSLFSLGLSAYNTVKLNAMQRHIGELRAELPDIRRTITKQQGQIQSIGRSLKGTILIVNTHSEVLNKTARAIDMLLSIINVDTVQTQMLTLLMGDMLRSISTSVENLATGRIPLHLVPLSLVESILTTSTKTEVTPLQAHLAYTLGSAVPIFVDPQAREIGFLVNLPIITTNSIYRLKSVINVGIWHENAHVRIQTPPVVAFHDQNPGLYLVPNLRMCTLIKDVHYLCPSKPFTQDNTDGICGINTMAPGATCPTTLTPQSQVLKTRAEIVGDRWLVSTPEEDAILTYDQHDTTTRVPLPFKTMWIKVPDNAIMHIGDTALYHLNPDQYESEIEISKFFEQHPLKLDPDTLQHIQYKGTQVIDVGPVDNVLMEISKSNSSLSSPVSYSWDPADNILVAVSIVGYLLTCAVALFSCHRSRTLQTKLNKCNSGWHRIVKGMIHERQAETDSQV